MAASVRFIRETDADAFRAVLDAVASERKYLATIKAPPLARVREFIQDNALSVANLDV